MILEKKIISTYAHILIIFFLALIVNQYFGNRGIFPIDSFSHFDTGFRVLKGEYPFKDYWVVSGPFVDIFQSFLFSIFGVSWQSYILNGSIINGLVAALSFKLFTELGLEKKVSYFYCLSIAILAYPVSATPFVDLHSTYLSLIAIIFLFFGLTSNKNIYFFYIPIFLFLGFLSKQVPAFYIFLAILLVLIYNFILVDLKQSLKIFKILILSTIVSLLSFFIFFYLKEIKFQSFIDQYLNYPREIGGTRYLDLNYDFKNLFLDFKFIHLIFALYLGAIIYKLIKFKNFYKTYNFSFFLICLFLLVSLIQHQLVTKNQIFIFFLIPFFSALVHLELKSLNIDKKKLFINLLFIFCLFVTFKYGLRFNIERKFHELNNVDFSNSVKASIIDHKFNGLNWITPNKTNKKEVLAEVENIKEVIDILKNDKENKMVITNFSFFSVILNNSQNSISRWFPGDISAFPDKNSKFFKNYRELFIKNIVNKKISSIYLLKDVDEKEITNHISSSCLNKTNISDFLVKFSINYNCLDFNR